MFKKLCRLKNKSAGQAAIILIIVTAIALIFYAVTLNVGGVSETKTIVTIASNMGASQLASQMASYGESIFQTQLGGDDKICAWTGLMAALVTFVIIVVVIVSCFIAACAAAPAMTILQTGVIIGLAAANVLVQAMIIQPGIDDMWNEIQAATMSTQDGFVEKGIRVGLSKAVSDTLLVPDITDADGDGIWGFVKPLTVPAVPADEVSRFTYYYSKRLKQIKMPSVLEIVSFQEALQDFMIINSPADSDGWGLHDPVDCKNLPPTHPCCGANKPSECNPCCQPATAIDPLTGLVAVDPTTGLPIAVRDPVLCPDPDYSALCTANTAYANSPPAVPQDYPWVYDPFFENFVNDAAGTGILSFRERMGQDDRNQEFGVNPGAPAWRSNPSTNKQVKRTNPIIPAVTDSLKERFFLQDAMSYYPLDDHVGIFPVFYKLADWGLDLDQTPPKTLEFNVVTNPECHWCDPNLAWVGGAGVVPCEVCGDVVSPQPAEIPQLVLPLDPGTLIYNTTNFVDGIASNSVIPGDPPLAADQIVLPDGSTSFPTVTGLPLIIPKEILADDFDCADQDISLDPAVGIWKRGDDRFCRDVFPYDVDCAKFKGGTCDDDGDGVNDLNCACEDHPLLGDRAKFPDDILDSILNDIIFFFQDMDNLLFADPVVLANSFDQWYSIMAEWIEPASPPAAPLVCSDCNADPGGLWVFKDALTEISSRFTTWMYDVSFAGATCDDVWCVPSTAAGNCNAPVDEQATFDIQAVGFPGNGVRGDIEDIIACLDYNVNGPLGTGGNDVRFQACADNCNPANCSNLPRSLIPITNFDPNAFVPVLPGIQSELDIIQNCLNNCSDANCQIMPQYQGGTAGCATYFTSPPATFNENIDCLNRLEDYFPAQSPLSVPRIEFDQLTSCTSITPYFLLDPALYDFENPLGDPLAQTKACYNFGVNYFPVLGDPSLYNFQLSDCGAFTWVPGNVWYDAITTVLTTKTWSPADQLAFTACQSSCSNLNCQAMPYWPDMEQTSTWWAEYQASLPIITASVDNAVISNCVDNCNNLNCQAMPLNMSWGPGVPWYDEIVKIGQAQDRALLIGAADDWAQMKTCRAGLCTDIDCQAMRKYQSNWYPLINTWYDEVSAALLAPLSAGDFALINGCMIACTNQDPPGAIDAVCQFMPQIDASTCGVQYFPVDPATFDATLDCDASGTPNNANNWNNYIVAALATGNADCNLSPGLDGNPKTTADNGWLLNVQLSALEAQNQVAKFKKRQTYLQGRLTEMKKLVAIVDEAATKTDDFLRGPAQDLIQYRIDYINNPPETGLPKTAVYVWQDKPRPGDSLQVGYWHIVRVDARSPKRCNNKCGVGAGPDPNWPNVKTYKKSWGLKRCYALDNTRGIVKFRVTRFDESRRSTKMKFANGASIWKFRNYHPDVGEKTPSAIGGACAGSMDADPAGLPAGVVDIYKNAFILNERSDNPNCWDEVHSVLQAGVMTETCAQYDYDGSASPKGFSHKFIDCPDAGAF